MFDRAILALACVSALAVASPSLACEMHKDGHAKLTTATAEPAPLPPAPKIEVDTKAMQVAPVVPAEPAMTKRSQSSGYMGCMRNKQTVLLTH